MRLISTVWRTSLEFGLNVQKGLAYFWPGCLAAWLSL